MKTFNRFIRILDNLTDIAMTLLFVFFILLGAYAAYDSYMIYAGASDDAISKFKPGYDKGDPVDDRVIGEDMVAWLTVEGTNIDYPVMQGKDNSEYLNKDPFGDYSLSGSIFLDSRNSWDFTDYYSLIYGHHMEHSLMFGALDEYLKPGYISEHRQGELIVGKTTYKIRFFAVIEADATNQAIFGPTEFDEETLPFVENNSLYFDREYSLKEGERLIALSTCKFPNTADRTIVFGALCE